MSAGNPWDEPGPPRQPPPVEVRGSYEPRRSSGAETAAGYGGQVTEVAAESGQAIWSQDVSSYEGLAVDVENVYVAGAGSELTALSRQTESPAFVVPPPPQAARLQTIVARDKRSRFDLPKCTTR